MFDYLKLKYSKMLEEILEKENSKECTIIYKSKNKNNSVEIEGEIVPLMLGLIALEKQILTNNELKKMFESLKEIVGIEIEEE